MKAKALTLVGIIFFCVSCSHTPAVLPEENEVEVSRKTPDDDCSFIDVVRGRTTTVTGNSKDAIEDLKNEASNKGANFVYVESFSGARTAVTGKAYRCP